MTMPAVTKSQRLHTARPTYHLWMPSILGYKGGIQTYSAFLLQALQELHPEAEYTIHLKNDPPAISNVQHGVAASAMKRFRFSGNWPSSVRTLIFASQLIETAMRHRPNLVLASHI